MRGSAATCASSPSDLCVGLSVPVAIEGGRYVLYKPECAPITVRALVDNGRRKQIVGPRGGGWRAPGERHRCDAMLLWVINVEGERSSVLGRGYALAKCPDDGEGDKHMETDVDAEFSVPYAHS